MCCEDFNAHSQLRGFLLFLRCEPWMPAVIFVMTITVKNKTGLVAPLSVQREAGIKAGDRLEFKVSGGVINIIPKRLTADDEYTPEQRRIVNAQLAEGLEDIRAGRVSPHFNTVDEMPASLKSGRKTSRRPKTRSR